VQRGEIWWATFPMPRGSEPGYRRPVLVVSSDSFNRSSIRTIIVAAITSEQKLAAAPGNVRLSRRQSGLAKPSVVNVSQLLTLDKRSLVDMVKALPHPVMAEVDAGMQRVLDLSRHE
jgi:mRNA interferase MazF